MSLFKSNRYCGNCFWFTEYNHTCQFFKHQPDPCDSCMMIQDRATARKIIQGLMNPKYVDPRKPWYDEGPLNVKP